MGLIPNIDLATAAAGEDGAARVAAKLRSACADVGFFLISGHGVPQAVIDGCWSAARGFFDLPLDRRMAVAMPYTGYPYGYAQLLSEALSQSLGEATPADLKESYSIGPLGRPDRPMAPGEAEFVYAETPWPDGPQGFRTACEDYYRALGALAERLMALFARALDLPPDFFADKIDQPISALRMINYPDQPTPPESGQLRAGAHTDYGSLTILLQDDAPGGLQVCGRDGVWHDVPAIPGTFVVNIGDLMARWTNDRWISTLHRVVNPPPDAGGSARRQSIAFFHQPNWSAEITCLPGCVGPGESPRYPPTRSGPHLMSKFQSTVELSET